MVNDFMPGGVATAPGGQTRSLSATSV